MRCITAVLIVLSVVTPTFADVELEKLDQWFARPQDEREPSYPFVRCAGLYMAALAYAGEKRLGKETAEGFRDSGTLMSFAAAQVRSDNVGGDPMDYQEQVAADRERIFDIYVERMRSNYAATGQAIMSDSLIMADFSLCKRLINELSR